MLGAGQARAKLALSPLCLLDDVRHSSRIVQKILRGLGVKHPHKRETLVCPRRAKQALQHGLATHSIESTIPSKSVWDLGHRDAGLILLGWRWSLAGCRARAYCYGSDTFVRTQLQVSRAGHDQLLRKLDDLQASWLLLLFCCSPRCNYLLRMRPPSVTAEHDSAVLSTFADFLGVDGLPDQARRIAQLPLSLGDLLRLLGLCLPVLGQHLPPVAQAFLRDLEAPVPHVPCLRAAATSRAELSLADWTPPSWRELCDGVPVPTLQEDGPSTFVRLRFPLPLSQRYCRCRRPLDSRGDPRSLCSGRCPPEPRVPSRAGRRAVCREAGARVTCNTRLADMNLQVERVDDRRLEVVANGLPFWGGQQLAVDTTLVSPLSGLGQPCRPRWSCSRRRPCLCTPPQRADIPGAAPLGALPLGCLGC